jgi:hypothetical protein
VAKLDRRSAQETGELRGKSGEAPDIELLSGGLRREMKEE